MVEVQHKTELLIIPITFYIFEGKTRPKTSTHSPHQYTLASSSLKSLKLPTTAVNDAMPNISQRKHVMFSSPLQSDTPIIQKKRSHHKLKLLLKSAKSSQDHSKIVPFQDPQTPNITPFPDHHHSIDPFQDHSMQKMAPLHRPFNHTRCLRHHFLKVSILQVL